MINKERVVVFIILVLAFVLRFYRLTGVPPGFTDDEASIGYNAYSVLKTGRDEYGRFLPIAYYKSLGDYKLPFNMYLIALSEAVFGLNKFAVRAPSALLGTLSVLVIYVLVKELFVVASLDQSKRVQPLRVEPYRKNRAEISLLQFLPLFSAFLLAISPWHVFSNRLGYEINIANLLFLMGVFLLIKGLKSHRYLFFSLLFFLLTLYTYHSYWIFVPAFLIVVLFVYKEKILKFVFAYKWQLSLLIFIFVLPLLLSLFNSEYKNQRVGRNIFGQQVIKETNSGFNTCRLKVPSLICKFVHNRPTRIMRVFFGNYLMSFSFLVFFAPTGFDPRDVMPDRGLLYLFEFPLIFIGLVYLLKKKHSSLKILLPWLFAYPLSHSLTEFSTATRMFLLLPLPQILAGFGFYMLFTRRKILSLIFTGIILISFLKFIPDLFFYNPYTFSRDSQYGQKEIYDYLKMEFGQTDKRIFIDEGAVRYVKFLFFDKYDPQKFIEERDQIKKIADKTLTAKIRNIYFVSGFPDKVIKEDDVLVSLPDRFDKKIKTQEIIKYLDGSDYVYIVSGQEYLNSRL